MKKRWLTGLLAATMLLSLAACGQRETDGGSIATTTPAVSSPTGGSQSPGWEDGAE